MVRGIFGIQEMTQHVIYLTRKVPAKQIEVVKATKTSEGEMMMKKRTKLALFSISCAVALIGGAFAGTMSPFAKTKSSAVMAPEPPQSCNAVTITNISSQSIAANQGEKVTVDWAFTDTDCVKVEGFEVLIEVTRRTGRKNNRKVDVSSTARSANVTFTEVGIGSLSDEIKSAKATVTAKLSNATAVKTQGL